MRAREFLLEYKLLISRNADGVAVKATAGGKNLGHAEFFFDQEGRLDPQTVWVDERYHGQGIAANMYDYLKDNGYTIVRSWDQTDAGRGFWDKHRGDQRVWEDQETLNEFVPPEHDPWGGNDYNLSWNDILNIYRVFFDSQGWDQELGANSAHFFNRDNKIFSIQRGTSSKIYQYAMVQQDRTVMKGFSHATLSSVNHVIDRVRNLIQGKTTNENFADGKVKGKSRPGRVKRAGASCAGSVTDLRRKAKNASGEKAKMYHWCANMKSGKKKNK
jgi:hypothetical protein